MDRGLGASGLQIIEVGDGSKKMEMRNIPKATRLSVQMNIKNEKNKVTQSCETIAMETMLVSRKKFVRQKMIVIWVLSNWKR